MAIWLLYYWNDDDSMIVSYFIMKQMHANDDKHLTIRKKLTLLSFIFDVCLIFFLLVWVFILHLQKDGKNRNEIIAVLNDVFNIFRLFFIIYLGCVCDVRACEHSKSTMPSIHFYLLLTVYDNTFFPTEFSLKPLHLSPRPYIGFSLRHAFRDRCVFNLL